ERQRQFGAVPELPERRHRAPAALGGSFDAEAVAATGDLHVEGLFDLAQVLIERAAQVRESPVVGDIGAVFQGLRLQAVARVAGASGSSEVRGSRTGAATAS